MPELASGSVGRPRWVTAQVYPPMRRLGRLPERARAAHRGRYWRGGVAGASYSRQAPTRWTGGSPGTERHLVVDPNRPPLRALISAAKRPAARAPELTVSYLFTPEGGADLRLQSGCS